MPRAALLKPLGETIPDKQQRRNSIQWISIWKRKGKERRWAPTLEDSRGGAKAAPASIVVSTSAPVRSSAREPAWHWAQGFVLGDSALQCGDVFKVVSEHWKAKAATCRVSHNRQTRGQHTDAWWLALRGTTTTTGRACFLGRWKCSRIR